MPHGMPRCTYRRTYVSVPRMCREPRPPSASECPEVPRRAFLGEGYVPAVTAGAVTGSLLGSLSAGRPAVPAWRGMGSFPIALAGSNSGVGYGEGDGGVTDKVREI